MGVPHEEYRLISPFFITKGSYSTSSQWERNLLQEAIMQLIAGGNSWYGEEEGLSGNGVLKSGKRGAGSLCRVL